LRHESHEFAMRGEMAEVSGLECKATNHAPDRSELLMWNLQKILEQSKLAQDFESGGMNGVAAEVAKEVLVFLEYGNRDTGTR